MKKKFETPELQVILFDNLDIIATSSGPNEDGFGDFDDNDDF